MIGLDDDGHRAERQIQNGFAAVVAGLQEIAVLHPDYAGLLVRDMERALARIARRMGSHPSPSERGGRPHSPVGSGDGASRRLDESAPNRSVEDAPRRFDEGVASRSDEDAFGRSHEGAPARPDDGGRGDDIAPDQVFGVEETILELLAAERNGLTVEDLYRYLHTSGFDMKRSALVVRLRRMVAAEKIENKTRGQYVLPARAGSGS